MLKNRRILLLGLLVAMVVLPLFFPLYQVHVLVLSLINIMFALSVDLVLGRVGQPNFGQAAFLGIGAYASALFSLRLHWPVPLSFLGAIVVSMVAGFLIGKIALRMRFFYFCIVTISVAQVFMLTSTNAVGLTGGPMGLTNIPRPTGVSSLKAWWLLGFVLTAAMLLLVRRLDNSKVGRAWVSMRESEKLALAVGVNTVGYALLAYVIGAGFAGIAGSFYAHYVAFIDPSMFDFSWSSMAVVATVIGGKGTVWGPLIGGAMITIIPEFLRVASAWRLPIFGLLLIVIVVFMPNGLISLPRVWHNWRSGIKEQV